MTTTTVAIPSVDPTTGPITQLLFSGCMLESAWDVEVGAIGAGVIVDVSPPVWLYLAAAALAEDSVRC